jgi:hypothetical protein
MTRGEVHPFFSCWESNMVTVESVADVCVQVRVGVSVPVANRGPTAEGDGGNTSGVTAGVAIDIVGLAEGVTSGVARGSAPLSEPFEQATKTSSAPDATNLEKLFRTAIGREPPA